MMQGRGNRLEFRLLASPSQTRPSESSHRLCRLKIYRFETTAVLGDPAVRGTVSIMAAPLNKPEGLPFSRLNSQNSVSFNPSTMVTSRTRIAVNVSLELETLQGDTRRGWVKVG